MINSKKKKSCLFISLLLFIGIISSCGENNEPGIDKNHQIIGTWKGYYEAENGIANIIFKEDGHITINDNHEDQTIENVLSYTLDENIIFFNELKESDCELKHANSSYYFTINDNSLLFTVKEDNCDFRKKFIGDILWERF